MQAELGYEPNREAGAALVVGLIFLGVITVLSVSALRSGVLGVRMSQNEEARYVAIQNAQALTESVVSIPATTPVIGGAGYTICTANEGGCNSYNFPLPAEVQTYVTAGHLSGRVERLDPDLKPPPRIVGSSVDKFSAAGFQVTATYDRRAEGLGRVQVVEGVIVLTPNF